MYSIPSLSDPSNPISSSQVATVSSLESNLKLFRSLERVVRFAQRSVVISSVISNSHFGSAVSISQLGSIQNNVLTMYDIKI